MNSAVAAPVESAPAQRIAALRIAMRRHGLKAYVVPSSDPHLSEYLPPRWQGRQWLSGFTGSAGTLVVTQDEAGLWVDSRYWLQADKELQGSGIATMRATTSAGTPFIEWVAAACARGDQVGVDGRVLAVAMARTLQDAIQARGATLRTDLDLLQEVWPDRPELPATPVFEQQPACAPVSRHTKLAALRQAMARAGARWHLISSLDDVAWVLNLRGSDVAYNPVFLAHLLVGSDAATLFIGEGKVPPAVAATLTADGVQLAPYAALETRLAQLPENAAILIDPRRTTFGIVQSLPAAMRRIEHINPTTLSKAVKGEAEAALIRQAMEQDGAALADFFVWLEQALARREAITELTIDERITQARARRAGYFSPSFPTIAGFNANGALPHYRATPQSHAVICDGHQTGNGLLLIDSGGQYHGGTTDITRVVAVGAVSAEQRRDFTRVLKGMIALARARFPRGTRSPMLDTLARAPIWAESIDYGHGTGHGVGFFLNVHEGPHAISPYVLAEAHTALEAGMITSDEPGIYRPGRWGVRIENLLLAVPAPSDEFGEFLQFETLTLCPIDRHCIQRDLLRQDEIDWLNDYHQQVRHRLRPHVQAEAAAWLEANTQPL